MSTFIFAAISLLLAIALMIVWSRWRRAARADYIRTYMFPKGLLDKFGTHRPELTLKERQLVAHALRQFFLAHLKSGCKFVAMPSQVADDLWHEFILYTRHYEAFCNKAFGQFMHHTPAVVLGANRQDNTGLRRTWWYCCIEENINPKKATRLPLLFSLDEKLKIPNGFRYMADCKGVKRQGDGGGVYCGGDMADSSFDGTTEGFGDFSFSDAGGGSDSSGCGGGCGGGD